MTGDRPTSLFCWALLGMLTLGACGDNGSPRDARDGQADHRAVPVETATVRLGKVAERVEATGTIFPVQEVRVSAETAGKVTAVHVEVGDRVERGTLLVQLDEELKRLALQQAEARAKEARAAYEKSVRDFERNKKLFESRDISEFVYENVRLQMQSAEAAYLTAKAQVAVARRQLRDTRIVSPIAGQVAERFVDLGSSVAPGAPVAKIVNLEQVKVKFGVAEKDIVKLAKGQPVTVGVDALPDEGFEGHIQSLGPQADLRTRTFPVEVLIPNPDLRLKAGMIARVQVVTGVERTLPLIPKSALLQRGGRTLVYVVENGVAVEREPELGPATADTVAVLAGVRANEEVVVLGQENLTDGVSVVVRPVGNSDQPGPESQ